MGEYKVDGDSIYYKTKFKEAAKFSFNNEGKLILSSNTANNLWRVYDRWPEIEKSAEEIQEIAINMYFGKFPDGYRFEEQIPVGEDVVMAVEEAAIDMTVFEEQVVAEDAIAEGVMGDIAEEAIAGVIVAMDTTMFKGQVVIEKVIAEDIEKVTAEDNSIIYHVVEQMPEFVGGVAEMHQFIAANLRYPQEAASEGIEGRVSLRFIINKDGSISDVEATRKVNPHLDEEAIRVVKAMPKWNAGKLRGKNVRVYFSLPITFRLN
ncbi:energy transducer TonB [Dysgonomonas sp. 511]|nr:energy transducer TonB [Dysgonomonas sp. 511]